MLVVITAAVVAIAAVLVGQVLGPGGESAARQAARTEAKQQASNICFVTLPANERDDVEKKAACIKREARAKMADWDAAHPDG